MLYLTPRALELLGAEAERRTRAAGVEVSAEGAARALVYQAMGLAPDGRMDAEGGGPLEAVAVKLEQGAEAVRKRGSISGQAIEDMASKLEQLAQDVRAVKGGA